MCGMFPGIEVAGLQFGKALTPDLLHRFGERQLMLNPLIDDLDGLRSSLRSADELLAGTPQ